MNEHTAIADTDKPRPIAKARVAPREGLEREATPSDERYGAAFDLKKPLHVQFIKPVLAAGKVFSNWDSVNDRGYTVEFDYARNIMWILGDMPTHLGCGWTSIDNCVAVNFGTVKKDGVP